MARSSDRSGQAETMVSLGPSLARSQRFRHLFAEGMALVEEASLYLDGVGRDEARLLPPAIAAVYATESMRLTTRLMQMASWLLIRRAIIDGEIAPAEASAEPVKVRISAQQQVSTPAVFVQLPARLQALTNRSLGLQQRILHLDRMVNEHGEKAAPANLALEAQFERLRATYPAA